MIFKLDGKTYVDGEDLKTFYPFFTGTIHLKKLTAPLDMELPPPTEHNREFEKALWNVAIKQVEGKPLTKSEQAILECAESLCREDEDDED